MLDVVAGSDVREAAAGAVMIAGPDVVSLSAAAAGVRPEKSARTAAEADSALINEVRIDVRLPR